MATGTVYLIHLSSPLGHARHYIGWSQYIKARFNHHKSGTGARMLAVANQLGIDYKIVRTWPGDRAFERLLKNRKNAPRYCPICNCKHPISHEALLKPNVAPERQPVPVQ